MSDLQHNPDDDSGEDFADGPVYDEGVRRRLSPLARMLAIAALGIAVVALGSLIWFAYSEGVRSGAEEAAPVLRADSAPVKRKPENPGGMEIPHRDKLVYDRIAPSQAQQPVERLLPPPETPVERPAARPVMPADDSAGKAGTGETASEDKTVAQSIKLAADAAIERSLAQVAQKRPLVRKPEAETKPVVSAPPPPAPPAAQQAAAPPRPAPSATQQAVVLPPPPALRPAPAAAPVSKGPAWRIQLASLSSEAGATKEWQRMQQANADLLGGLALKIQTAKLSKGTYYRIQAGPLGDRTAASALCGKLKTRKQDCLVVAP